jgi:hypothetical protein
MRRRRVGLRIEECGIANDGSPTGETARALSGSPLQQWTLQREVGGAFNLECGNVESGFDRSQSYVLEAALAE